MNKGIFKILICALILFIGIGAVSALDDNSTDEIMSFEQDDEISVSDIIAEEDVASCDNGSDVLGVEGDSYEIAAVCDNGSDVLCVEDNGDEVVGLSENNSEVLTASVPSGVPIGNVEITHSSKLKIQKASRGYDIITKEFVFSKVKMSKKDFNRFIYNTPSKSNKKLWKKYKKFQKTISKKYQKSLNKRVRSIKRSWEIDWYYGIRPIFVLKGKYCTMNWVCMAYRWI